MKKENLTEEQMIFQDAVRTFMDRECKPNNEQWEKDGIVSREVWLKAGENNFFGIDVPEEYGGMGMGTMDEVVVQEEFAWGDPGFATAAYSNGLTAAPISLVALKNRKQSISVD